MPCRPSPFLPVRTGIAILATLVLGSIGNISAAEAQTGYLAGKSLVRPLGGPPTDADAKALDLAFVRAERAAPGSAREDEAVVDAMAYDADVLVGRFSDAARAPLSAKSRPVLVYILSRALADVGDYAKAYKNQYPRDRPYVEDTSITGCYDTPAHPLKPHESYPSGHATNGYTVALLLADVMPARRQQLLARGLRYGENRVACGVHHPSDVRQGQVLAMTYVETLEADGQFKKDLDCARAEEAIVTSGTGTLTAECAALHP